jgi:hypothetical protein
MSFSAAASTWSSLQHPRIDRDRRDGHVVRDARVVDPRLFRG